jgi:D-alanyl-lipoteichoic acid acyltransferase DltB (MBOAT superfamily)
MTLGEQLRFMSIAAISSTSAVDPPVATSSWTRPDLLKHLFIVVELILLLAVVHWFDIAGRNHLFAVLTGAVGGYLIQLLLPTQYRLWFFALLSMAGILFVLGWRDGLYLLGLGGLMIGICYLPIPFALRLAIMLLMVLVLIELRLEFDRPFWALLGSMFMFRMIVYLFEQRKADTALSLPLTLAYFFPLPNVSFLFFPIIDFKTFRDTYQSKVSWLTAQGAIVYFVRGITHLLLYRAIKYYILPDPHQITDVPSLAFFMATNYALYLHVSGYFHLITGTFHLFGFQLPRTHHNYFLAESFTDIWRRINIYWKDFMAKVFFVPVFFRLRGWGTSVAVTVATLFVFLVTWLFHSYQVFWLTGAIPFRLTDAYLWLGLGILVTLNLLWDLSRAGKAPVNRSPVSHALRRSLRIAAMFSLISLFWSFWNIPSFGKMLRAVWETDRNWVGGLAIVLGVLLSLVVLGTLVQILWRRFPDSSSPMLQVASPITTLLLLTFLGGTTLLDRTNPHVAKVLTEMRQESASPTEGAYAVQGYYEDIADLHVPAGALLAAIEGNPHPFQQITYTDMSRPTDDLLERELIPNWSGEVAGSPLSINRWGMRDPADRQRDKPADTFRMAMVGSSVIMGYGVEDNQVMTQLLEQKLNTEHPAQKIEVLNFGTGKSYAIQRHVLIDRKVMTFQPNVIFYFAHQDELLGPIRHLGKLSFLKTPLPYPSLQETIQRAGIDAETSWGMTESLLKPHAKEIVSGVYRHLVGECRAKKVVPVWVYLPMPGVVDTEGRQRELFRLAEEAGFIVIDLSDWAKGYKPTEVKVGEVDPHANALGHRLIAERLYEEIKKRADLLPK